ncbi:MAG: helix-turn-helix transcriptional regulator [Pseudomonadota bacterium]|nr:helix-turn-helix transcriptional regulator [Pseudomonadota bacterium]
MPATSHFSSVVDRQLLLQLGGRLKRARVTQGLTTTQMAERAGISRMTLSAVEAGEPTPTIGSYLRIMSVLGVSQDLVLVASDALPLSERPNANAQASSGLHVAASDAKHELQDLQSLMLHQEAVRLMRKQPELIQQALDTLDRWRKDGGAHSRFLWDEWSVILHRRAWRRALSQTKRAKELRQASPLTTVLPPETRQCILDEVQRLKKGIPLGQPPGVATLRSEKGPADGT